MEFLTIQALAKQFGLQERNARYRVFTLLKNGAFVEPEDIRKDNFKDDKHFVWKINPVSFTEKTGLQPILFPNGNKPNTKQEENSNEIVELLKKQLEEKNMRIERLERNAENHAENMKKERDEVHVLTGALIQKQNKVEELLMLTGGQVVTPPATDFDTRENPRSKTDIKSDTKIPAEAEVIDTEPIQNTSEV